MSHLSLEEAATSATTLSGASEDFGDGDAQEGATYGSPLLECDACKMPTSLDTMYLSKDGELLCPDCEVAVWVAIN